MSNEQFKQDLTKLYQGEILEPALARYREIVASAPPAYTELAESMLVHELSLHEFVQLELAGEGEHSLDAVRAQIQHKIPPPG